MTHEARPTSRWIPEDWRSTSAWLESAHRAARALRREVAHATPQQIRHALEVASRLNPGPWGGEFREVSGESWQGAEVRWKEREEGVVVWVHGGAFAFGSPRVYRAAAVHLAKHSRCKVLLPQYRLAPEHVYPAAHDDVLRAIEGVLKQHERVVLVGDSAGGNLVLGAMQKLLHKPESKRIRGVALLSPWCDLRPNAKSIASNAVSHSPFDDADSLEYSRNYLSGHAADDPHVSALAGARFEGFPPVYAEWALDEFLAPDIDVLRKQLLASDVALVVRTEAQAIHGWQTLPDVLPEAKRSSDGLGRWVRERLSLDALAPSN